MAAPDHDDAVSNQSACRHPFCWPNRRSRATAWAGCNGSNGSNANVTKGKQVAASEAKPLVVVFNNIM